MVTQAWSIEIAGDWIHVRSPFELKDVLKSIPGAQWDRELRLWKYPKTPSAARSLQGIIHPGIKRSEAFERFAADAAAAEVAAQAIKTAEELPPVPLTQRPAWLHQLQAYWFTQGKAGAMLALDMGTGKTKVALDLIQNEPSDRMVLVVCPKSVVDVWPKEVLKHMARPGEWLVLPLRRGSLAQRAKELLSAQLRALRAGQRLVVVVNYEAVWREPLYGVLQRFSWDRIVADESHRIKAPNGSQSKALAALGRKASRRLALTGTPMPHSPLDIYAQYRFLDPTIFGTSFARFRNTYAHMGGYGGHQVLGYRNQDDMNRRIFSVAHRVMATDVLDLIPPMHETRTFTLAPAAARAYQDLKADFVTFLDGKAEPVTASNALVRLLRMQQITSGFLPTEDGSRVKLDGGKAELLVDLIEDLPAGEPVVVFCRFTHDLDTIQGTAEARGLRYGELSGRRRDAIDSNAELAEGVDVAGVQMASGGVGIDFTRARYCVYYSLGFSLGDYEQSLARIQRPGQSRRVIYYHLLADKTVDSAVYAALDARKAVVEALMAGGFE